MSLCERDEDPREMDRADAADTWIDERAAERAEDERLRALYARENRGARVAAEYRQLSIEEAW